MTDKGIEKREESLRVFSQTATIYDRIGPQIFSYFGQRLVDLADLGSGGKVLDVAAGRGAVLFPSSRKDRTYWPCDRYRLFSRHGTRNS